MKQRRPCSLAVFFVLFFPFSWEMKGKLEVCSSHRHHHHHLLTAQRWSAFPASATTSPAITNRQEICSKKYVAAIFQVTAQKIIFYSFMATFSATTSTWPLLFVALMITTTAALVTLRNCICLSLKGKKVDRRWGGSSGTIFYPLFLSEPFAIYLWPKTTQETFHMLLATGTVMQV